MTSNKKVKVDNKDVKVDVARRGTDTSLGEERAKTDVLNKAIPEAELATDVALQESRDLADSALHEARRDADVLLQRQLSQVLTVVAEAQHALSSGGQSGERAAVDVAVSNERQRFDEALVVERGGRTGAGGPVDNGRAETDDRLRAERGESDQSARLAGLQLLGEQAAHSLAKLAVQNRDEFIALVSHELRNPLTTIVLNAELLEADAPPDVEGEATRVVAKEVRAACQQMTMLIGDLLDAASMEAGRLQVTLAPEDAVRAVKDAASISAPVLRQRGLALVVEVPQGPVMARFDHSRLRQVFANLLTNAVKFTPTGGTITVGLTPIHKALRFFVRDTGVGISAPDATHVFERFWQLGKDDRRGLGLGLYICKAIVESHGGSMWVESVLGEGTTFYFTVPVES